MLDRSPVIHYENSVFGCSTNFTLALLILLKPNETGCIDFCILQPVLEAISTPNFYFT